MLLILGFLGYGTKSTLSNPSSLGHSLRAFVSARAHGSQARFLTLFAARASVRAESYRPQRQAAKDWSPLAGGAMGLMVSALMPGASLRARVSSSSCTRNGLRL